MDDKIHLLSTISLDSKLVDGAAGQGIVLDTVPFIIFSNIVSEPLQEEIALLCRQACYVVFTSANGVRAVAGYLTGKQPEWGIFCIGNATKNAALEYFIEAAINGTADDAISLADKIIAGNIRKVIFFCGDKRMDSLPEKLRHEGIEVKEIIVYRTSLTPRHVAKEYDGILFFSPSGVDSFFSINKVPSETILFAIGDTTAKAIKLLSDNFVVVSDIPSKEVLIKKAINYLHNKAITIQENSVNERT